MVDWHLAKLEKGGRIQEYYIFYRLISLKSAVNFTALLLSTSDGMFKFVFKRILMVIPTFIAITSYYSLLKGARNAQRHRTTACHGRRLNNTQT